MAAIELGAPYTVTDPTGTVSFKLNQAASSPPNIGYVTEITGLDSPGVRENAQTITAGDGGHHGAFWKDRRPFTISGIIYPAFPLLLRDQLQELMEQTLMGCLTADGSLTWTPADGVGRLINFRTQQRPTISTGQSNVVKNFLMAGVSADWRIWGQTTFTQSASLGAGSMPLNLTGLNNAGNAPTPPAITITGPVHSPSIVNLTTGKTLYYVDDLNLGNTLVIDLTGQYPAVIFAGVNRYGSVDPLQTNWDFALAPGLNNLQLVENITSGHTSIATSSTALSVSWRNAWL